jgi:DNA-binding CsgD family transcriptional regulator
MGIVSTHERAAFDADESARKGLASLAKLSSRQRSIMGLTASGFTPQQVAEQLCLSHEVVRQDLVRAYKVLVPEQASGKDRRTQAVLAYIRQTRDEQWDSP